MYVLPLHPQPPATMRSMQDKREEVVRISALQDNVCVCVSIASWVDSQPSRAPKNKLQLDVRDGHGRWARHATQQQRALASPVPRYPGRSSSHQSNKWGRCSDMSPPLLAPGGEGPLHVPCRSRVLALVTRSSQARRGQRVPFSLGPLANKPRSPPLSVPPPQLCEMTPRAYCRLG